MFFGNVNRCDIIFYDVDFIHRCYENHLEPDLLKQLHCIARIVHIDFTEYFIDDHQP